MPVSINMTVTGQNKGYKQVIFLLWLVGVKTATIPVKTATIPALSRTIGRMRFFYRNRGNRGYSSPPFCWSMIP